MKTVAIVQGRMASSRLPDKILKEIGGQPMLAWVVERAKRAAKVDQVVVATTAEASDDPVETFCREQGYPCYRGSMHDVLDRFYQAARTFQADVVVRFTADCPLIDPGLVDQVLDAFFESRGRFRGQPPAAALHAHLPDRFGYRGLHLRGARAGLARSHGQTCPRTRDALPVRRGRPLQGGAGRVRTRLWLDALDGGYARRIWS